MFMRPSRLALVLLAGVACRKGELQPDAGGGGMLSFDATAGDGLGTGDGDQGATDVVPPTRDNNCGLSTSTSSYHPPQILVLVDESVSGDKTKWTSIVRAVSNLVVQNAAGVHWGLYTVPQPGPACGSGTFSPAIDIPVAPMNADAVAVGIRAAAVGASDHRRRRPYQWAPRIWLR